jgi:DNA sulfur modification protein DndD
LQARREQLEDQLAKTAIIHSEHDEQRQRLLRSEGYLAFLNDLPARVIAAADQLRERGELPAPIKRTFIEDLLANGQCICGSDVSEGTAGRSALEAWRTRTGLAEVEAAWNTLRGAMGTLDERRQSVLDALTAADVALAESAEEERRLREELNEVSVQLKKMPLEEIGTLESRREELMQHLTETSQEFGAIKSKLTQLVAQRSQKESTIEHLQVKGAANERIQRRIAVIKEVKAALEEILQAASEGTRQRLESRIRQLFVPISLKKYEPRLTADFQLEYWQHMGGQEIPAPKSTGENMLLSLSFVAAVAAECRAVAESQNPLFAGVGGEFPVVMDAAFGNLDDDYRRQIANFLPDLTPQVVVLTSKAQSAGVVDEQLSPRIGKQYIITTHTTRRDLQDVTEQISLSGRNYPYQVTGSDWDGAELTEVRQ